MWPTNNTMAFFPENDVINNYVSEVIIRTIQWHCFWKMMSLWPFNALRPSDAYICVNRLTIIGPDNGLSPGRRQAIIWTNDGILSIRTVATNFDKILSEIHTFSFKKMHLKMSSAKWRHVCFGPIVFKEVSNRIQGFLSQGPSNTIVHTGLILGLCPANERRRYSVTTSLIGWAQT